MVVRLDYKRASFLFTGDAESATERWLLTSGHGVAARVLKVGHHGSRFSSTPRFVKAVHPEIAVVSVGEHNAYKHPSEEILVRWRATGARVYRTDQSGTVTVTTDGDRLVVTEARHPSASPALRIEALAKQPCTHLAKDCDP